MQNFHCKSKTCRRVVGKTDGQRLVLWTEKEVPFDPHLFGFTCPFCGEKVVWHKLVENKSK